MFRPFLGPFFWVALPAGKSKFFFSFIYNAGVLTDPMAPSSFGAWVNHAGSQHIGAISFLLVDFFLFTGVAALTAMQASQVRVYHFLYACTLILGRCVLPSHSPSATPQTTTMRNSSTKPSCTSNVTKTNSPLVILLNICPNIVEYTNRLPRFTVITARSDAGPPT